MVFKFEFPSLKKISMIQIGHYLINEKILPFPNDSGGLKPEFLAKLSDLVGQLKLPSKLLRELYHVLGAIYSNLSNWHQKLPYFMDSALKALNTPENRVSQFLLDMHGQLDEERTWDTYFNTNLAQAHHYSELSFLLRVALYQTLLPQITLVLKKILSFASTNQMELEEPSHEIFPGRYRRIRGGMHVLVYRFRYPLESSALHNVISWLNTSYTHGVRVTVDESGIVINLGKHHLNYQLFEHHFYLIGVESRMRYLISVINSLAWFNKISILLKILQFQETELLSLLKHFEMVYFKLLTSLMDWPYTDFILHLWKNERIVMSNNVLINMRYSSLFTVIINKVLEEERHDEYYEELLLEFLRYLPEEIKHHFRDSLCIRITKEGHIIMKRLLEKNEILYQKVIDIISDGSNYS